MEDQAVRYGRSRGLDAEVAQGAPTGCTSLHRASHGRVRTSNAWRTSHRRIRTVHSHRLFLVAAGRRPQRHVRYSEGFMHILAAKLDPERVSWSAQCPTTRSSACCDVRSTSASAMAGRHSSGSSRRASTRAWRSTRDPRRARLRAAGHLEPGCHEQPSRAPPMGTATRPRGFARRRRSSGCAPSPPPRKCRTRQPTPSTRTRFLGCWPRKASWRRSGPRSGPRPSLRGSLRSSGTDPITTRALRSRHSRNRGCGRGQESVGPPRTPAVRRRRYVPPLSVMPSVGKVNPALNALLTPSHASSRLPGGQRPEGAGA